MSIGIQLVVLFIVIAAVSAWLFRASRNADAVRAERFGDREDLSINEWQQRFYPDVGIDSARLGEALNDLACNLGIPAGKLRPTDKFDFELAPMSGWEPDDSVALLSSLIKRRDSATSESVADIRNLDEYLRAVISE